MARSKEAQNRATKKKTDKYRALGLCVTCGKYPPTKVGGSRCRKCYEVQYKSRSKRKADRLSSGVCIDCGKPTLKNRNTCLLHYLRETSNSVFGTRTRYGELLQLMHQQDFKCGLTGDPITFNDNIELDHIIPRSKKGFDYINNLRWVIGDANLIKLHRTDEELYLICLKILKHANRI